MLFLGPALICVGFFPCVAGFYYLIPVAVVAFFVMCWALDRMQKTICPKCGQPFTDQTNPTAGWASLRVAMAEQCQSCGLGRGE